MLGNVDVQRVRAADDDWLSEFDRYIQVAGMPYRNMSALRWFSASYEAAARSGATGLIESTDGNATYSWVGNGAVPSMIRNGRVRALIDLIRDIRREGRGSGALTIPRGLWALLPGTIADPLASLVGVPRAETAAFLRPANQAVRTAAGEIRAAGHWNRMVRPIRDAADRFTLLHWSDRAPHNSAVERMFGIELCDPYSSKRVIELTSRIEEHRFLEGGFGRRFARIMLKGRVPEIVASGQIDWTQATDWRFGAVRARPALLDDLAYARADPELAEFYDLPAIEREVQSWTVGAETREQMTKGFAALRAIGTIRFARWAANLPLTA
jgi:asparagine synthase (glutamine-hydrolysing)